MSESLFHLTADAVRLSSLIEMLDQDSEEVAELQSWLAEVNEKSKDKIDAYCWVIRKLETEAKAAKAISDEFADKTRSRQNRIEQLKSMMREHMAATGQRKVEGHAFKVALQANGGSLPIKVVDSDKIPNQYFAVELRLDKDRIRCDLEQGVEVPGAVFGERGESLRIR